MFQSLLNQGEITSIATRLIGEDIAVSIPFKSGRDYFLEHARDFYAASPFQSLLNQGEITSNFWVTKLEALYFVSIPFKSGRDYFFTDLHVKYEVAFQSLLNQGEITSIDLDGDWRKSVSIPFKSGRDYF